MSKSSDLKMLNTEIHQLKKKLAIANNTLKKEEFGLTWMDVPEAFDTVSENKLPVLEEIKEKAITNDDGKLTHMLIEGDNYHALTCLNYSHKGKIDLIYIDPPYNTGSDGFVYKDKRILDKFPDGTTVPTDHPLRHSYWLSFMSKRLKLAKSLLSDSGVIHISIDDNEYAQLKLLCDKIFNSKNFIATLIWEQGKKHIGSFVGVNHEYILIYAKDKAFINDNLNKWGVRKKGLEEIYKKYNSLKKKFKNDFTKIEKELKEFYKSLSKDSPSFSHKHYNQVDKRGIFFAADIAQGTGKGPRYDVLHPISNKACSVPAGGWRYKKETMLKLLSENRIYFGKNELTIPCRKRYLKETEFELPSSVFYKDGRTATGFLKKVLGSKKFNNPKDTDVLKEIFGFKDNKIILDFFAGSGSTAQAVMELNEQDSGKRQWILVTNNENQIMDQVCYPRIEKIMSGVELTKTQNYTGLGNSLKYYKTSFVGNNSVLSANDKDKIELAQKAGCLLSIAENTLDEVEHTSHFQFFNSNDRNTAIYFQEDLSELDTFVNKVEKLENPTTVYLFSWGNKSEFESMFDHISNMNIKTIPQPILEIYKKIYNISN